jgi:hypothetical protein
MRKLKEGKARRVNAVGGGVGGLVKVVFPVLN